MSKLTGTVLVTGGTLGLGYQAALQIAQQRPEYQVIVASRKDSETSAAAINKATGRKNAVWLPLDLSSLTKVRTFAEEYSKKDFPPIKALLLNAGLQIIKGISYTEDGFETTFGVNHIGHALLFYLLRPQLAPDARIVITASGVHDPAQKTSLPDASYTTAEALAHPTPEMAKRGGRQHYSSSKLANVLWTYALDRHIRSSSTITSSNNSSSKDWTVTAFDPGLMPGTGLARDASPLLQFLWHKVLPHLIPLLRVLISPNIHTDVESGFALARLGVGEDVKGKTGIYFEGLKETKSSADSYVVEKQEELWEWTSRTVARDEGERKGFEEL